MSSWKKVIKCPLYRQQKVQARKMAMYEYSSIELSFLSMYSFSISFSIFFLMTDTEGANRA